MRATPCACRGRRGVGMAYRRRPHLHRRPAFRHAVWPRAPTAARGGLRPQQILLDHPSAGPDPNKTGSGRNVARRRGVLEGIPAGAGRWRDPLGAARRGRSHQDDDAGVATIRFAGVFVDITEQKRVEEHLHIAQTAGAIGTFEYVLGLGTASVSTQFCSLLGLHPARELPVRTINSVGCKDDPPIIDTRRRDTLGTASHQEIRIRRRDSDELRWLVRRGEYYAAIPTAARCASAASSTTSPRRRRPSRSCGFSPRSWRIVSRSGRARCRRARKRCARPRRWRRSAN